MYTSRHHFYKRRWRCKNQLAEPPRPKSAQNWHFKQVFGRILTNTLVVRWARPRKNISGLLQGKLYTCVYAYIYIYIQITVPISVDDQPWRPTCTVILSTLPEEFVNCLGWHLWSPVSISTNGFFGGLNVIAGVDPLGDLLFFGYLGYLFDGCRVLSFAFGTGKQLWVARLGKGSEGQKSAAKVMESNDFGRDDQWKPSILGKFQDVSEETRRILSRYMRVIWLSCAVVSQMTTADAP